MFEYNICNQTDKELFQIFMSKIMNIPSFSYVKTIEDVDGSLIGIFSCMSKNVVLKNDEVVRAMYIESQVELEGILFDK